MSLLQIFQIVRELESELGTLKKGGYNRSRREPLHPFHHQKTVNESLERETRSAR